MTDLITDSDLRVLYANAPVEQTMLEVISIEASWFSQTYYLQNKDVNGIDVELETGETVTAFYAPMSIGQSSSNDDLNYERTIIIQMVNDIIASESSSFNPLTDEPPVLRSRGYILYRDGTVSGLKTGVVSLEISDMDRDEIGSSFNASTTKIDDLSTGEVATTTRIPMLKAFI